MSTALGPRPDPATKGNELNKFHLPVRPFDSDLGLRLVVINDSAVSLMANDSTIRHLA